MNDSYLARLLAIASNPLSNSGPTVPNELLEKCTPELADDYIELLEKKNGFFAFEGALHVFPVGVATIGYNLEVWNSLDGWVSGYGDSTNTYLFIAEDIFGEQFAIKGNLIYRFDPENATFSVIAESLEEWASKILLNYHEETGYKIAHEWQVMNGALEPTKRLVPKMPFILGGGYELSNLMPLDEIEGMRLRADIWQQIKDLPPGTDVKIQITE